MLRPRAGSEDARPLPLAAFPFPFFERVKIPIVFFLCIAPLRGIFSGVKILKAWGLTYEYTIRRIFGGVHA